MSYRNSCGLGYGSPSSTATNLRVVGKSNSCVSLHTAWPTFCCQQSLLAGAEAQELQLFFPCPLCRGQPHWWHQHCSAAVTHSAAMLLEPACPHPSPLPAAFSISRQAPSLLPACLCSYVQNQVRDLIPAKKIACKLIFFPAGRSSSVWFLGWLHKHFGWHKGGKRMGVEISNFAMRAPSQCVWLIHRASSPLSASVG